VFLPKRKEFPPYGYNRVEVTPSGHPADINSGSGGTPVYLAYRQGLWSLQSLRSGLMYS
ncbi:unnamed protein product, partial [Discosporangium mesarthrocarpum]